MPRWVAQARARAEDGDEVEMGRRVAIISSAVGALLAAVAAAVAEVPEVRFARQFSISYLQFNLMERRRLVDKHAKAAGIPEVKLVWATFNSPAAMNDALLSGSVDIVSGGVPGLLTIWSRTQGTANAVKGIAAFTLQPIVLNTRNRNIRGIADFSPQRSGRCPRLERPLLSRDPRASRRLSRCPQPPELAHDATLDANGR
jgi:ABC-type nitrate/sulfonate/bicarbonate transport system substrate-binding protein